MFWTSSLPKCSEVENLKKGNPDLYILANYLSSNKDIHLMQ